MIVVLIGRPCSGKSTLGKSVASNLGIKYISSGDIARKLASEHEDTKELLDNGHLAPEDMMRDAILSEIKQYDNMILDGFPRFYDQYKWLLKYTPHHRMVFMVVDVDVDTAYIRSTERNRSDDGSFAKRNQFYEENTVEMMKMIIESNRHDIYTTNSTNVFDNIRILEDIIKEKM